MCTNFQLVTVLNCSQGIRLQKFLVIRDNCCVLHNCFEQPGVINISRSLTKQSFPFSDYHSVLFFLLEPLTFINLFYIFSLILVKLFSGSLFSNQPYHLPGVFLLFSPILLHLYTNKTAFLTENKKVFFNDP